MDTETDSARASTGREAKSNLRRETAGEKVTQIEQDLQNRPKLRFPQLLERRREKARKRQRDGGTMRKKQPNYDRRKARG